jgi:hypothetical protein
VHSNQSDPSNEAAVGAVTGAGGTPPLTELQVLPNYPNPFSVSTQIDVGLPGASDISVEVFDVAGRKVDDCCARCGAGWRKISLSPRDNSGHALASGVYFYRVRAAGNHDPAEDGHHEMTRGRSLRPSAVRPSHRRSHHADD